MQVERLTQKIDGARQLSASLRIFFEGDALPTRVKIGYITYPVRPYSFRPLQCFNCQRYGHAADGCRSARRCMVCAGPHHLGDCTSASPHCANCRGDHKANSMDCPKVPGRGELPASSGHGVSTVAGGDFNVVPSHFPRVPGRGFSRSESRFSSGGASVGVPEQGLRRVGVSAEVHHRLNSPVANCLPSPSYSGVLYGGPDFAPVPGSSSPAPGRVVAGYSLPVGSSSHGRRPSPVAAPSFAVDSGPSVGFFRSLSGCLSDLFALSLHKESPTKVRLLVASAVQKHFSVVLPDSLLSVVVPELPDDDSPPAAVSAPVGSPVPSAVCSPRSDLDSQLNLRDFQLASESAASADEFPYSGSTKSSGKLSRRKVRRLALQRVKGVVSDSPIVGGARKSARIRFKK